MQKPVTSKFVKLTEGFENFVISRGYKTGRGRMYVQVVQDFLIWCEGQNLIDVKEIQSTVLSTYYNYLTTRPGRRGQCALSQITINHHLFGLRLFIDHLWETKEIDYLVVVPPNLKIKKSSGIVLQPEEIHALFQSAKKPNERAVIALAYGCGLRSHEITALRLDDILFATGHLVVRHGKGNKTREIPMSDAVHLCLREYVDQLSLRIFFTKQNNPLLFFDQKGNAVTNLFLNRQLKLIRSRSENIRLKKLQFSLHDLRHSIATHLSENGAGIEFVRDFLGHNSIDTSSLYMIRRKRRNNLIAS